jgi:hypothetical protein
MTIPGPGYPVRKEWTWLARIAHDVKADNPALDHAGRGRLPQSASSMLILPGRPTIITRRLERFPHELNRQGFPSLR